MQDLSNTSKSIHLSGNFPAPQVEKFVNEEIDVFVFSCRSGGQACSEESDGDWDGRRHPQLCQTKVSNCVENYIFFYIFVKIK